MVTLHSRTVFAKYGSHNLEHLKKKIGHTFWRAEEPEKHRYIYLLCGKKYKKKIMNTLIHEPKPYPKDAEQYYPEVKMIFDLSSLFGFPIIQFINLTLNIIYLDNFIIHRIYLLFPLLQSFLFALLYIPHLI